MNLMCFESFKSAQTTNQPAPLDSFRGVQCLSKLSNLFKPLVEHNYKAVSHEFDVF